MDLIQELAKFSAATLHEAMGKKEIYPQLSSQLPTI
jgi:hypothetical protein